MKTAVVILNWNGEELLKKYLPKVVANTPDAEVIIADNASSDNSILWIKSTFPELRIIEFEKNHGFAQGYNLAIAQLSEFRNIILLNSDAMPEKHWIAPLEEALAKKNVAAAQPKILSARNKSFFEYAGAAGGFIDKHGYPYCRGRIFNTVEQDKGQYNSSSEIFWASGAALAVKREAYLKSGGLDPLFFAHMEEIDLCWRLKLNNYKILYIPQSIVYHLGGGSLNMTDPRKTYLNFRNNLLMLYKNLPDGKEKDKLLFRRRLLDTLAWLKFMCSGNFANGQAIIKAHKDFKSMRGNYSVFPSIDLLQQECKRNIIFEYYLHGKKIFADLS